MRSAAFGRSGAASRAGCTRASRPRVDGDDAAGEARRGGVAARAATWATRSPVSSAWPGGECTTRAAVQVFASVRVRLERQACAPSRPQAGRRWRAPREHRVHAHDSAARVVRLRLPRRRIVRRSALVRLLGSALVSGVLGGLCIL